VDAEGALDHHGHALGGPDIAAEAIGWRPAGQQPRQLGALLGRETRGEPRRWPVRQRRTPLLTRGYTID
jgi:hypothetical protein